MKNFYLLLLVLFTGGAASAQCVASFSGTQAPTGNNLLNVNFTNSSGFGTPFAGQYKTMYINYGDGSKGSLWGTTIPSHNYASTGTYTVGLRISSIDSSTSLTACTDSATITVTVSYPPCGTIISASGTSATQTFSVSNPAGTSGITYAWSFGDGGTATGSSPVHTYTGSGFYTITCVSTVGSPVSCTYTNTMSMWVTTPAGPLNCSLLQANFTATVIPGGSTVVVNNTSTVVGAPYFAQVKWYWGDGTTDVGWYPSSHIYATTGTFTIKAVVEWSDSMVTTSCKDSITKNVTITAISPATIYGNVEYDSLAGYDTFKVWLIQFNSATNILSAVDSQIVMNNATQTTLFTFQSKPPGNYLVKAADLNGPVSGTGMIPTYYYSNATWSGATTIAAAPGSYNRADIYMLKGTVTSGPGFVGGNVSLGANKGANSGVGGRIVLLRNPAGDIVQMATTDANGDFSFSNIPTGTYSVYPEFINYATTPAPVSVSNGGSTVTGINFFQDDVKMNIKPHLLAVGNVSSNGSSWSAYPNPAHRELNISWKGVAGSARGVVIMDVAGKTVLQMNLPATSAGLQHIDIGALRSGLYFIHGSGALSGAARKLVVE